MEAHREAFHNRMEFVHLPNVHQGTEKFPYDDYDLAKYLMNLYEVVD